MKKFGATLITALVLSVGVASISMDAQAGFRKGSSGSSFRVKASPKPKPTIKLNLSKPTPKATTSGWGSPKVSSKPAVSNAPSVWGKPKAVTPKVVSTPRAPARVVASPVRKVASPVAARKTVVVKQYNYYGGNRGYYNSGYGSYNNYGYGGYGYNGGGMGSTIVGSAIGAVAGNALYDAMTEDEGEKALKLAQQQQAQLNQALTVQPQQYIPQFGGYVLPPDAPLMMSPAFYANGGAK